MLSTNGDEVGLGVPAMTALFPDMMPVLYVLAGIQKMCFLPPALVMLGVSRELKDTAAKLEDGVLESVWRELERPLGLPPLTPAT